MSPLPIKLLTSAEASAAVGTVSFIGILFIAIPLILSVGLGFIPADIAGKKGYSFRLFWLFGFFLFIPALIVALCIEDKNAPPPQPYRYYRQPDVFSGADELKKYSELHDSGAITDEEFEKVKADILGKQL